MAKKAPVAEQTTVVQTDLVEVSPEFQSQLQQLEAQAAAVEAAEIAQAPTPIAPQGRFVNEAANVEERAARMGWRRAQGLEQDSPLPFGMPMDPDFFDFAFEMEPDAKDFLYAPEKYLKDPMPGALYAWAKYGAGTTNARVSAHMYRYVKLDELKDEHSIELTTADGTAELVHHYDLVLVEVPPKAKRILYDIPAKKGIYTLVRAQGFLDRGVKEQTQGLAHLSIREEERTVVR